MSQRSASEARKCGVSIFRTRGHGRAGTRTPRARARGGHRGIVGDTGAAAAEQRRVDQHSAPRQQVEHVN